MRQALFLLGLFSSLAQADWSVGPSYNEDQQTWYRVFDVQGSTTVGWINGWQNAVKVAACPTIQAAMRAIITSNPQLQNTATAVTELARVDGQLAREPPFYSEDGTRTPPAEWILDGTGARWTLTAGKVYRDAVFTGGWGTIVAYRSGIVYHKGTNGLWMKWTGITWASAPAGFEP